MKINSFNPCFGGSYIMTLDENEQAIFDKSFNPCFGGSYIMTVQIIWDYYPQK